MSVRNLAAAGLVIFGLGGPALFVGIGTTTVTLTVLGAVGLWVGLALVAVALLQLGRSQHRLLLAQSERIRRLSEPAGVAERAEDVVPEALEARLTDLEQALGDQVDRRVRDLLRTVDARILGIHDTVRDLAGVGGPPVVGGPSGLGDGSAVGDPAGPAEPDGPS